MKRGILTVFCFAPLFASYTSDIRNTGYSVFIEGITNTGEVIKSLFNIKK